MDASILKTARVLILDDEPANVRLLERLLLQEGYSNFRSTTNAREALALVTEFRPDLLLLDLHMPHLDGFGVMEALRPMVQAGRYFPILVLTADIAPEAKRRALASGAKDFLIKPFDTTEALLRIRNLLETRLLHERLRSHPERLEEEVRERTRQLLQTEKLTPMGELLAGVAHELNNPLSVAIGQADLLVMDVPDGPLAERATSIRQACERAVRIVRNFLTMARQHAPERQPVSLNQIVRDAVEMLGYQLRVDQIEGSYNLAPDLPLLWADPHQLHQVLVNLVVNAHHAMRGTPPPRKLALATRPDQATGRVSLEVADTGPGIPLEIQARIFEPFFTTKSPAAGTGLGLSLCQGLVEAHGGTIGVRSTPGEGVVFVVELPVGTPPPTDMEARTPDAARPAEGKTVLVVEDETAVANTLAEILRVDGHQVDIAPNGAAALEQVSARAYDLILADLRMPVLDGPGLYRELERRHPDLCRCFAVVTGDTVSPESREFVKQVGVPYLRKPYRLEEVRRVVRHALQRAEK